MAIFIQNQIKHRIVAYEDDDIISKLKKCQHIQIHGIASTRVLHSQRVLTLSYGCAVRVYRIKVVSTEREIFA